MPKGRSHEMAVTWWIPYKDTYDEYPYRLSMPQKKHCWVKQHMVFHTSTCTCMYVQGLRSTIFCAGYWLVTLFVITQRNTFNVLYTPSFWPGEKDFLFNSHCFLLYMKTKSTCQQLTTITAYQLQKIRKKFLQPQSCLIQFLVSENCLG